MIEGFGAADRPWRMFVVAAVVRKPWAGRFVEDLKPEIQAFRPVLGEIIPRLHKHARWGKCANHGAVDGQKRYSSSIALSDHPVRHPRCAPPSGSTVGWTLTADATHFRALSTTSCQCFHEGPDDTETTLSIVH
ncbi:hypothetical protein OAN307_c38050 [Octadecabacter antarcticus 307]|uniref:Uncharacterized protein n=1 Tax=Octadecabacter antarcticus 307 TaxID=391626 RepID=M9RFN3_9RHOB|nr:hypothetical protein OAN307_c38050 [Octadecabacter antarcticus 307]